MRGRAVVTGVWLLVLAACSDSGGDGGRAADRSTTSLSVPVGDLALLAERIVALHPDPFHAVSRAELERRAGTDPSDPDRLLVAAMRLANLGVGDGHGGVYPWAQSDLEAWPIHLYDFGSDGLRAVGGDGVPVGSRLLAVGDAPIEDVIAAVEPLVPHDNEWTVRSRLPAFIVFPAVLRGLGFDVDELTWQRPDGTSETVPPPDAVPAAAFAELLGLFQAQVPPSLPYDRDRIFWSEVRGRVLYVRWNQVQRIDAASATALSDLATSMVEQVGAGAIDRVVIDARHNPGGEIPAATPLVLAITEIERARPGTVRFLVGRSTFSAASNTVARLREEVDVTVVGEPTGGSNASFADPSRVVLPASRLVAFVDTAPYIAGDRSFGPVEPDVAVELTWADYAAGRDPALDAAMK